MLITRHNPTVHGRKRVPSNMDYATLEREMPVVITSTASPRTLPTSKVFVRKSRVMNTDEDKSKAYRRVVKKSSLLGTDKNMRNYQVCLRVAIDKNYLEI